MNYLEKTLLSAYPYLQDIMNDMDRLIKKNAYTSFASDLTTYNLSEKILGIIERKERLKKLKIKLDKIFEEFTIEDMYLLELKYFKRKNVINKFKENFSVVFSQRTYFRKQLKLSSKFLHKLNMIGFTDNYFLEEYNDIGFLVGIYNKFKEDENKKIIIKVKEKDNYAAIKEKLIA